MEDERVVGERDEDGKKLRERERERELINFFHNFLQV